MKQIILPISISLIILAAGGCAKQEDTAAAKPACTIKVGHVGHDHHLALFVAADYAEQYQQTSGVSLKKIEQGKRYELYDQQKKIADVIVVKVGGGAKMPTALAQDVIDIGLGGIAAVLASADSGAPVKLISPLHCKGDMFVVKPDFPAENWAEFIRLARETQKPIRIGYKDPVAVAKVIFEQALVQEKISFGGDTSADHLQVLMVNVKGGDKLNVALGGGLIDGYVGNNPFPAIAATQKTGKIISDLNDLPPGIFRNHPCCCIAANTNAFQEKSEAIENLLVLLLQANETINTDLDKAIASAVQWTGTSETVERLSIPTSGYSMETSTEWFGTMEQWIRTMNDMNLFQNKFKDRNLAEIPALVYDFSLLEKANAKLAERKSQK